MPPEKKLTQEEIKVLKNFVASIKVANVELSKKDGKIKQIDMTNIVKNMEEIQNG